MSQLKYYDSVSSSWKPLLAGAQGANGAQGAQGAQGPQGYQGIQGAMTIQTTSTNASYYVGFVDATSGSTNTDYINSSVTVNPSKGELTSPEIVASNALIVNKQSVSSNYTIGSNYNAFSIDPITVNAGVSVTTSAGQRWVVI